MIVCCKETTNSLPLGATTSLRVCIHRRRLVSVSSSFDSKWSPFVSKSRRVLSLHLSIDCLEHFDRHSRDYSLRVKSDEDVPSIVSKPLAGLFSLTIHFQKTASVDARQYRVDSCRLPLIRIGCRCSQPHRQVADVSQRVRRWRWQEAPRPCCRLRKRASASEGRDARWVCVSPLYETNAQKTTIERTSHSVVGANFVVDAHQLINQFVLSVPQLDIFEMPLWSSLDKLQFVLSDRLNTLPLSTYYVC